METKPDDSKDSKEPEDTTDASDEPKTAAEAPAPMAEGIPELSAETAKTETAQSEPAAVAEAPAPDTDTDKGTNPGAGPSAAVANELKATDEASKVSASKPIKPPKKPGNGVAAAVIGTVLIVLALSALAVFAYLKSPK